MKSHYCNNWQQLGPFGPGLSLLGPSTKPWYALLGWVFQQLIPYTQVDLINFNQLFLLLCGAIYVVIFNIFFYWSNVFENLTLKGVELTITKPLTHWTESILQIHVLEVFLYAPKRMASQLGQIRQNTVEYLLSHFSNTPVDDLVCYIDDVPLYCNFP